MRNIIADIRKKGKCLLSADTLFYATQVLEEAYLERIKDGFAVNVLGLGRLYHALSGMLNSMNDFPSRRPKVIPRFTPSKAVVEVCAKLKCRNMYRSDTAPQISEVRVFPPTEDGSANLNSTIMILGENLKAVGEGAGVFLIPKSGGKYFSVSPEKMHMNFPKSLEFYLPQDIPSGEYEIEVRTRWSKSGREKKDICLGARAGIVVM